MATLNDILKKQADLIVKAKKELEAAQNGPPLIIGSTDLKNATVAELKDRMRNLRLARDVADRQIDEQIKAYEREIAALSR